MEQRSGHHGRRGAARADDATGTLKVRQKIGATEPLRTGSYAKTLTFTLSTTAP